MNGALPPLPSMSSWHNASLNINCLFCLFLEDIMSAFYDTFTELHQLLVTYLLKFLEHQDMIIIM